MILSVRTEGDVEYFLDNTHMQWERVGKGSLRTDWGLLSEFPNVVLGKPAIIIGPSLDQMKAVRRITTKPVVTIQVITGKPAFPLARFIRAGDDGLLPMP